MFREGSFNLSLVFFHGVVRLLEIFFEAEFLDINNSFNRHDFCFFVVKPGGSYNNLFVSLPVDTVSQLDGVFSLEGGD